jgi:hypothetical protein
VQEDEDKEEGKIISSPNSHPLNTSPHLVTSSAGKRGSPLVLTGQSTTGWTPGDRLACRHSPTLYWYTLTYWEHMFALAVRRITLLLRALLILPSPLPVLAVVSMMVGHPYWASRVQCPHPSGITLGLSCQCPLSKHLMLIVSLRHSHFSCFSPEFKKVVSW